MPFSKGKYRTIRQSLDGAECCSSTASEEDLHSLMIDKPHKFQTSIVLLSATIVLLLSVVATQTVFLVRSAQPPLSKGTFFQLRDDFSNDLVPSWVEGRSLHRASRINPNRIHVAKCYNSSTSLVQHWSWSRSGSSWQKVGVCSGLAFHLWTPETCRQVCLHHWSVPSDPLCGMPTNTSPKYVRLRQQARLIQGRFFRSTYVNTIWH